MITKAAREVVSSSGIEGKRSRAKNHRYVPKAKDELVQALLSLEPGQRVKVEFEMKVEDHGDSLMAVVSLCDHQNKQAYVSKLLQVISINRDAG